MPAYVFEFINKSPEEDSSVLVLNGDLSSLEKDAELIGYCSEDGESHDLTAVCMNPMTGEWRIRWNNQSTEDVLIGLHGSITIEDVITRVADNGKSEWDYSLRSICLQN